jgi:hypothetical protein
MRTGSKGDERPCGRRFRFQGEDPQAHGNAAIRELSLTRRRSRIPWIYAVYQARRKGRGWALADRSRGSPSALPTQKRRHIQRRLQFEVAEVFV